MAITWELRDYDLEFFARELESFVPPRVFDAHAHLYEIHHWNFEHLVSAGPPKVTLEEFQKQIAWLMPNRKVTGLFFGVGFHDGYMECNRFVSQNLNPEAGIYGQMVVPPGIDPDFMRATAKQLRFRGLKVYHLMAPQKPTWNAEIASFLTEEHVRVAHEERWTITLHMVKNRSLADRTNQETIVRYCRQYPGIKLILAHAARGFNAYHTVEGIECLKGLPNVWCDLSAVTEAPAMEAIGRVLGHQKMLWGSDYPISHLRGRCISMGDQFVWLYEDTLDWDKFSSLGKIQPYFVGHESLRALKTAATNLHLSDSQVEDVFHNNAMRMLQAD